MSPNDVLCSPLTICPKELQERAQRLAAFPITAQNSGNAIIMYAMLVLNSILTQQVSDPITNLDRILSIATILGTLNTSIQNQ